MALFLSHKYHNVLPIRSGKRHVLVMELWNGPEKTCPHRCETVGKCTHTLNRSHLGNFSQHVRVTKQRHDGLPEELQVVWK